MKVDPSGSLLTSFIDLNNLALARFSRRASTQRLSALTHGSSIRGSAWSGRRPSRTKFSRSLHETVGADDLWSLRSRARRTRISNTEGEPPRLGSSRRTERNSWSGVGGGPPGSCSGMIEKTAGQARPPHRERDSPGRHTGTSLAAMQEQSHRKEDVWAFSPGSAFASLPGCDAVTHCPAHLRGSRDDRGNRHGRYANWQLRRVAKPAGVAKWQSDSDGPSGVSSCCSWFSDRSICVVGGGTAVTSRCRIGVILPHVNRYRRPKLPVVR